MMVFHWKMRRVTRARRSLLAPRTKIYIQTKFIFTEMHDRQTAGGSRPSIRRDILSGSLLNYYPGIYKDI